MQFRIADTFTDSLARLTGEEQKAVKTTAFDLQVNPAAPGLNFHRIDHSKDKNFSSVRVNKDIRLIVHRTPDSLLLCYVDHHDKAYAWAERRKLETHPKTGAAQMVELRETVREIVIPAFVQPAAAPSAATPLFDGLSDDEILGFGVPTEWLKDVRAATDDSLLTLADHLPAEAAEALLEIATGGRPKPPVPVPAAASTSPFEHPDAQRRFRVMKDVEELTRALEFPWDKWTVFLHPSQRELVEGEYNGPVRVSGSAGTGKTIVALHRAVYLARRHPDTRILLTTFSEPLARALSTQLRRLISNEPRLGDRIDVATLSAVGRRLYERQFGPVNLVPEHVVKKFLESAARQVVQGKTSTPFLLAEWNEIVDAWQIGNWEAYRDQPRLGRKTRVSEAQRETTWSTLQELQTHLNKSSVITEAAMFWRIGGILAERPQPPYDFIVVDEAQDLSVPQLRFLAALGAHRPDALFFTGDLGQRIFQLPFSWKSLGVDIRGRSWTLHVNYRTSHQIRTQADRLLAPEVADVDGNTDDHRGTISVFNGPAPAIEVFSSQEAEEAAVAQWLKDRVAEGVQFHELAVFVRSDKQVHRAEQALKLTGMPFKVLDESLAAGGAKVGVAEMHLAKGLEYRGVAVMGCDDEVLPLQERIEQATDEGDLTEVYNTERHLLYVACTRARDFLILTGCEPASEFLSDLRTTA